MIITINPQDVIPIIEKTNYKAKKMVVFGTNNGDRFVANGYRGGSFSIDRAGSSDLFNFRLLDRTGSKHNQLDSDDSFNEFQSVAYVAINNKPGTKLTTYLTNSESLIGDESQFVHHTRMNDVKFSGVETLAFGADAITWSFGTPPKVAAPLWRNILFFDKGKNRTEYKASFDKIYRFDSIAKIENTQNRTFDFKKSKSFDIPNDWFTTKYSHIYVIPVKPSRSGNNETLAKIYYSTDDGVDHEWYDDIGINTFKSSSSTLDSYNIIFEKDVDANEKLDIDATGKKKSQPYKIGEIKMNDFTYFDQAKKKMVKGFGKYSKRELTVPYSLEGFYNRTINIGLNSVFKNVSLDFSTFYDRPYLNPSNGIVDLKIKEDNSAGIVLPTNALSENDIKLIRTGKIKSLIGLERLGKD